MISYKVNSSYAIFTDTIEGEKTIEISVNPNLDSCNPNKPVLSENMIAVYYDEANDVWRKADSENKDPKYKWYDYCDKIWANSVTVTSTNRSTYLSADLGTEIPMNDILTMQVWIPRYKYIVWNYNLDGTVTSEPQEIQIKFEEGTMSTGEISCSDTISGTDGANSETCKLKTNNETCTDVLCNGKTYTHPAFTFGDKELEGFWTGKFEVSSDKTCTVTDHVDIEKGCNLTSIRPLVKPNEISWRGAMVSIFENSFMIMNDINNKYGFAETDDTHMIKNSEWGAISYLSHSKYGTNKKIVLNSNSGYKTGCGPQSEGSTSSGTTCNAYNTTLGQSASTTGNIYGIYDMNGGAFDFVMGNIVSPNGQQMMSGYSNNNTYPNSHSGYSGILYNTNQYGDFLFYDGSHEYPADKYIDKYSYSGSAETRNRSKLGDGMKEIYVGDTHAWYNTYAYIATYGYSWIRRGSYFESGAEGAIFYYNYCVGDANEDYSSRLVISQ